VNSLDELDGRSSPMKAKGVDELGSCGVGAAIANAISNAGGVRVREYPITLDKQPATLTAIKWHQSCSARLPAMCVSRQTGARWITTVVASVAIAARGDRAGWCAAM